MQCWTDCAVALLITSLVVVGCATSYGPRGFTGGYEDTVLAPNTFLVSFTGNGYTSNHKVEQGFLRRCAELTVAHGFDYFVLMQADSDSTGMAVPLPGTVRATTSVYGSTATTFGTYQPGPVVTIRKHTATGTVRALTKEEAASFPTAVDAQSLLEHVR